MFSLFLISFSISWNRTEIFTPIGDYTGPVIWSSIEVSVGVICACLPTLRPVAQHLPNSIRTWRSSGKSDLSTPRTCETGPSSSSPEARKQFYLNRLSQLYDDYVLRPEIASRPVHMASKQSQDSLRVIVVENKVEVVRETV